MPVRALQVRSWEWPPPFTVAGGPSSRPPARPVGTGFPAATGGAPPALSRLFSVLCEADALEAGRSQAVWVWLHRHGQAWRGGAPDVHAVDVAETPTVRAVQDHAHTLGLDGEALVQAIADEVATGVCLAEAEAVAVQALAMPHAHPQTWVRALDPAAVTEGQVQAIVRGAIRNALRAGDERAVLAPIDKLLLPAASHALGRAALFDLREALEARATDGLFGETAAPHLAGQRVGDTADALCDALDGEAGLVEVVLKLGDGRRHAVLLSTRSTVNGPWFYDPNHLGFFCAQRASTRTFVRDFADYLERMYGEASVWHWIARLAT